MVSIKRIVPNRLTLEDKKNMAGYVYIIPFLLGMALVFLPSIVQSFTYVFQDVSTAYGLINHKFVWLKNFHTLFTVDANFREYVVDFFSGMTVDTIVIIFFSFFVASILNQKFHGRGAARTIFFLPVLLAAGFVAQVDANTSDYLKSIYTNSTSTIATAFSGNSPLTVLFDMQKLLGAVLSTSNFGFTTFLISVVSDTTKIINYSGVQILIFLSALQGISPSIFEAAKVEGATKWEEFWKITFPMVTPMILVNIIYTIIDSYTNPKYNIMNYVTEYMTDKNQLGYAACMSWVYFVLVAIYIAIIWGLVAKRIQYLD